MRRSTERAIEKLHAEIARLVEVEKDYFDRQNPELNDLLRRVEHTRIEKLLMCPKHRANMVMATASLPIISDIDHARCIA